MIIAEVGDWIVTAHGVHKGKPSGPWTAACVSKINPGSYTLSGRNQLTTAQIKEKKRYATKDRVVAVFLSKGEAHEFVERLRANEEWFTTTTRNLPAEFAQRQAAILRTANGEDE